MSKSKIIAFIAVLTVVVAMIAFYRHNSTNKVENSPNKSLPAQESKLSAMAENATANVGNNGKHFQSVDADRAVEGVSPDNEMQSASNDPQALEDKQVDAFYNETDRWMDPKQSKPPAIDEIQSYHAKFKCLPKSRKKECLHRAMNLIPDENVMLLVGILMDKTEDKELVELIYNDVLNRDEDVKKPILQTIFKDKEHPCWADTAWILDVTGELPKTQK